MKYLSSLNTEQKRAASKIDGPLLLLAGAGTGKTRVITYRMLHMLREGIAAENIVAVTFTNKAAKEMKERLRQLCGESAEPIFVGTFHAFCIGLLRQHGKSIGLKGRFQIVATSDQIDFVSKALEEKNLQGVFRAGELHAQISRCKNKLISPDELAESNPDGLAEGELEVLVQVYRLYEKQLQLNHAIDFDDCIYKCVRLLETDSKIRKIVHQNHPYFLVDEFQDTNLAQLTLLRLLVNKDNNICVVGDDDQSIYSWRGAMYETIERFEQMFEGSTLIKLEQNYRCTSLILDAANKVIKNNAIRKDKTLWSEKNSIEPIVEKRCLDESEEAQWIALKILSLLGRGNSAKDIGILYRANALARPIEIALRENKIPYKVFGGQSFFERKEIKDFMAYIRLIINPNDRLSFWRVINTPQRGLGLKACELIEAKSNKSPYQSLNMIKDEWNGKNARGAEEFIRIIEEGRKLSVESVDDFEDLCRFVLKESRLDHHYKDKAPTPGAGIKKAEMIRDLPRWLRKSAELISKHTGKLDLVDLIDALTLNPEDRKKDDHDSNYVSLMTIHAAKGLEFPYVFLCGVEDDLLPHRNSIEEAHGISEERRLFYVALTRAKEQIFISHTDVRSGATRQSETKKPSRFLKEIPPELVVSDTNFAKEVAAREENRRGKTKGRLSSLRDEFVSSRK